MEPEQPSPDTEQESLHEEAHLPPPTLWPIGFAIGIVVFATSAVIVFNVVVDVAYAWLDPRIRLD